MTMRSFVDLGVRSHKQETHANIAMRAGVQHRRDGKVIEAKEENEEEKNGAETREGEKKSRTLNRPLALGLRVKRYDRRGRRIGKRKREVDARIG